MEYIFKFVCTKMRSGRAKRNFRSESISKRSKRLKRRSKHTTAHHSSNFCNAFSSRTSFLPAFAVTLCALSAVVLFVIFLVAQAFSQPCSMDSQCTSDSLCDEGYCEDGFCSFRNISNCCIENKDCISQECYSSYCVNGTCQNDMKANESYCEDGNFCTIYDKCTSGVCEGVELTCQITNECRLGECVDGVGCVYTSLDNGVPCDDLNLCTMDDICWNGMCLGTPRNCSSYDGQCALGVCDVTTGACRGAAIKQMESCNDGVYCTTGDQCLNGICVPGTVNPCQNEATCSEGNNDFECACVSGYTGKVCDGIVKAQITQAIVISGFSLTDVKENPVVQDSIQESIALSAGVDKSQVEILDIEVAPSARRRLLSSASGVNVDYRITLNQAENVTAVKETLETLKNDTSIQEQLMDTVKEVILEKRDANPTLVYFNPILFDPVELETTLESIQITTVIEPEEVCPIGSGFRNGLCFECENDEYNNEATTNTSSICLNRTLCAPGYKSRYTPSIFENNICVECDEDTYRGVENEFTECIQATKCGTDLEVDILTNKIIDTTCKMCGIGYESNDNGPCVEVSMCAGMTCFDNNPCTIDACVEKIGCMIQHRDYNSTCIPGCFKDVDCPLQYICYDGTCIKMSTSVNDMQIRFIGYEMGTCPPTMVENLTWVANNSLCTTRATFQQCQSYAIKTRKSFVPFFDASAPSGCLKIGTLIKFNQYNDNPGVCTSHYVCLCDFPFMSSHSMRRLNMNFVLDSEKYVIGNDTRYRVILDVGDIQMDIKQPLGFGNSIFNLNYNDFGYNLARTAFTVSTECHVVNASNCRYLFSNRIYRFAAKVHDCTDISSVPAKHCIDPQHYIWSNIYASVEDCTDFTEVANLVYRKDAAQLLYNSTRYIGYKNASDYLNVTNDNTRGVIGITLPVNVPNDTLAVITDLKICKGATNHHLGGCVDGTNHSECYNTGCFNWVYDAHRHENYPLNFEIDIIKDGSVTAMALSNAFQVNGCFPNDQYNASDTTKCSWQRCGGSNPTWGMVDGFEFNFKPLFNTRYYDNERIVFDIKYRYIFCNNGSLSNIMFSQLTRHQIH